MECSLPEYITVHSGVAHYPAGTRGDIQAVAALLRLLGGGGRISGGHGRRRRAPGLQGSEDTVVAATNLNSKPCHGITVTDSMMTLMIPLAFKLLVTKNLKTVTVDDLRLGSQATKPRRTSHPDTDSDSLTLSPSLRVRAESEAPGP